MIKTLYIHGLDSHPVPGKLEIMRGAGLDVTALHLDYRKQDDAYLMLKKEALVKEVQFIVGSSLGGFLGNWLAEELGLPCLLFNPAMNFQSVMNLDIPQLSTLSCPFRLVVLGASDDSVDPVENLEYFKHKEREDLEQRILSCHWLGHQIDFDTFESMIGLGVKYLEIRNKR